MKIESDEQELEKEKMIAGDIRKQKRNVENTDKLHSIMDT